MRAVSIHPVRLSAMPRLVSIVWFALLLGMQHYLLAHGIDHLGARVDRGSDVALHDADRGICNQCSLLAGGSNVVPLDAVGNSVLFEPAASPVDHPQPAPPQGWRRYYLSRAPPHSLS